MTTPTNTASPPRRDRNARDDRTGRTGRTGRSDRGLGLRVARRPARRGPRRPPRQRGIAILAVITAIAIALTIVNEFGTRTTIDMLQARNTLDQSRAHFLARSAVNLGELLLRMQALLDNDFKRGGFITRANGGTLVQVTGMSDQLMSAFGGDAEQVQKAVGVTSMDDVKGLGADIGQFGLRMVAVDGRINVNCAAGGAPDRLLLAKMLKSLLFPFATNSLFDDEDAEGWRRDAETQAEAIIDYIDTTTQHADVADRPPPPGGNPPGLQAVLPEGGGEDYGYENLRDRYLAKNNRLDSISELRLVRGVDDRLWTLFSGAFRVHGGCKINLRSMEDITVIASVISLSVKDPNDPGLRDPTKVWKLADFVLQARTLGETFEKADDFATFVKNPVAYFTQGLEAAKDAGGQPAAMPQIRGLTPDFTGLELDPVQLGKITTSDPPRAYQIEAWADVTRNVPLQPLRRTIRAMWDQGASLQNRRWPDNPKTGAWQWLREE